MELVLGKWSNHNLAEWFGVSDKGFVNRRKHYLELLADFAQFELVRGGVIITEIYHSTYVKNYRQKQQEILVKEIINSPDHLVTMSGLAQAYPDEGTRYTFTQARNQLFGETIDTETKRAQGRMGSRSYAWAIKLGVNQYRLPTEEEKEKFYSIIKKTTDAVPPAVWAEAALFDKEAQEEGYTLDQYLQERDARGFNFFKDVIQTFLDETGCLLVRASEFDICYDIRDEYCDRLMVRVAEQ